MSQFWLLVPFAFILAAAQHVKDPHECTKVCHPPGYECEWPDEFPEDVERVECKGNYCAKAGHEHPHEDGDSKCKPHLTCSTFCSEVCCVCLRECI